MKGIFLYTVGAIASSALCYLFVGLMNDLPLGPPNNPKGFVYMIGILATGIASLLAVFVMIPEHIRELMDERYARRALK